MFTTEIQVNKKKIKLKFGSWAIGQLIKSGYSFDELTGTMTSNPFDLIPKIVFFAACNAKERDLAAYDEGVFYDWLDSVGINSQAVIDVISLFTKSIVQDVPGQEAGTSGKKQVSTGKKT